MNKYIVSLYIAILTFGAAKGQAVLGRTESYIRSTYPEKKWTTDYTSKSGVKYISADMAYGSFCYYFDKETKLSDYCIQIPFNNATMNGQVEAYNKKYVITSDTTWTAYLEEGGIMYIKLIYNSESNLSYFSYSSTK